MAIKKETWRSQIINLVANTPMQITFKDTVPTVVFINNKSLSNAVYVGDSISVSTSKFIKSIVASGTQSVVSPQGYNTLWLLCQTSTEVIVESGVDNEINAQDIPQSNTTIIQNFQGTQNVNVQNPLPSGGNTIGKVIVNDNPVIPKAVTLTANTDLTIKTGAGVVYNINTTLTDVILKDNGIEVYGTSAGNINLVFPQGITCGTNIVLRSTAGGKVYIAYK